MLALVLGSGAAKGYAHIGVIKLLEEEGIKPDLVVGSSMGALVGGFYAAGFNAAQMAGIASGINKQVKRWLFRPRLSISGLVDGANILKFLSPYLKGRNIEDLHIKYAAVAIDLENSLEIIINKGDLMEAIRSSISMPVIFIPHKYAGTVLIDNFLSAVPITAAQKLGAKKVIAVNVLRRTNHKKIEISTANSPNPTHDIRKIVKKMLGLTTSRLIDYEKEHMRHGIFIDINTKGIGLSQFERAAYAIERGYKEAQKYQKLLSRYCK